MKNAVTLLLIQDGLVLAVSRRHNYNQFGLPGGKVDEGEANIFALQREVREETNLRLQIADLTPIYSNQSTGDDNFWTTCYLYTGPRISPAQLYGNEEGIDVFWRAFDELCDETQSPFAIYNQALKRTYIRYTERP